MCESVLLGMGDRKKKRINNAKIGDRKACAGNAMLSATKDLSYLDVYIENISLADNNNVYRSADVTAKEEASIRIYIYHMDDKRMRKAGGWVELGFWKVFI